MCAAKDDTGGGMRTVREIVARRFAEDIIGAAAGVNSQIECIAEILLACSFRIWLDGSCDGR